MNESDPRACASCGGDHWIDPEGGGLFCCSRCGAGWPGNETDQTCESCDGKGYTLMGSAGSRVLEAWPCEGCVGTGLAVSSGPDEMALWDAFDEMGVQWDLADARRQLWNMTCESAERGTKYERAQNFVQEFIWTENGGKTTAKLTPRFFEGLRSKGKRELVDMGCCAYRHDESVSTKLMLFPDAWLGSIPTGFTVEHLAGTKEAFIPGVTYCSGLSTSFARSSGLASGHLSFGVRVAA